MKLTVNVKNAPSEVNRPYIVVKFCAGELWYIGQYDDVERADDVAESVGNATVFDNSSYNAIEIEQEPVIEPLERLAESTAKTAKVLERLSEQERILDKIRVEINAMFPPSGSWMYEEGHEVEHTVCEVLADVLQIIDKYRKEN